MLESQTITTEEGEVLQITWTLDVAGNNNWEQLAELTQVDEDDAEKEVKKTLPPLCRYHIEGDVSLPFFEWHSFLESLQPFLDAGVAFSFSCSSQRVAHWLRFLGIELLGRMQNA